MARFLALFLSLLLVLPLQAKEKGSKSAAKARPAPQFYPIDDGEDENVEEAVKTMTSTVKEVKNDPADDVKTLDDFPGETLTGIPRLIRQDSLTEVFFRDLNQSYVIHQDSKHNRYYKIFDDGSRSNKPVTFRADPYSRRILAVEGVDGITAPKSSGQLPSSASGSSGNK